MSLYAFEERLWNETDVLFCGVDEAGRGPLAGPVYAAAVVLRRNMRIEGLNDSKKLSEKKRELLFDEIIQKAVAYRIEAIDEKTIDEINILNATMLAMKRAVEGLLPKPKVAYIDGNRCPQLAPIQTQYVIGGDAKSASIAAASILAKVSRDRFLLEISKQYPQYYFEKHKGYGTKLHYEMLAQHGISSVHRRSFLKKLANDGNIIKKTKATTQTSATGNLGEEIAARQLEHDAYRIVERNYRTTSGEIDIIAVNDKYLVFVEVKTRSEGSYGSPAEAVDEKKQKRLIETAQLWMATHPCALQPRFDVIEIILREGTKPVWRHIENAFGV